MPGPPAEPMQVEFVEGEAKIVGTPSPAKSGAGAVAPAVEAEAAEGNARAPESNEVPIWAVAIESAFTFKGAEAEEEGLGNELRGVGA